MEVTLDHNFTVYNENEINLKIKSDLEKTRIKLLREFSGIEALILVGGFGRGEGSVLREANEIEPINDYDIVMVSRQPIGVSKIDYLRKELAKELDIWWVDISNYTLNKLTRLRYTMYNYDLKYGSHVSMATEKY